ncbi:hypothetical protein DJ017_07810 [Phenylobacterium soli]|uniref:Lipoprotein n=2 Tax=Phenylobacterium soli TaxID=2170551 RepID=A0A328AK54_9CAUL|nr:hypothetical protein DJ017_07810 [Phenylobacterium soli]
MVAREFGETAMRLQSIALRAAVLAACALGLSGCLAASVAGAAVGVTAKAAATTVHVGHVAVDAVTPLGDKNDD